MKTREESLNFHPRGFVGNNIQYRIGSSSALARFKESQAFLLTQLAMNPFHEFSSTAKEILLLKFDVWFDFLCEIEQYILINQGNCSFDEISEMGTLRRDYVYDTLGQEKCINQDYLRLYKKSIDTIKPFLEGTAKEIFNTDLSPSSKFGALVDLAIQTINHILYVVQELDIVFYTDKTPILNLDSMSCDLHIPYSTEKICSAELRLKGYMEIRKFDEIIIKNYLDSETFLSESTLRDSMERLDLKYKII